MSNINTLVSVIVPVYKVEKYLHRCIDSIINQTYKNLEIILVDDGSPDNCGKICDEYAEKDNRIKVIHKSNGGPSSARNAGLDVANGDYVYFVDSDDYIHEDTIKDNLYLAIKSNADMVCFNFREIKSSNNIVNNDFYDKHWGTSTIIKLFYSMKLPLSVWSKLYKKHMWDDLRYPVGVNYEDFYVLPYVLENCKKIVCNKKSYYYYDRSNENSIMNNSKIKKAISTDIQCYKNFVDVAERNQWSDELKIAVNFLSEYVCKLFYLGLIHDGLDDREKKLIYEMRLIINNYKNLLTIQRRLSLLGVNGNNFIKLFKCLEYRQKYKNKKL